MEQNHHPDQVQESGRKRWLAPRRYVGAFAGTLPNPLDGAPSADASRFGAHVAWQDAAAARSRASLTLQGSRYLGRMDEQRITGLFESYPDFGRLGAHAELSLFDRYIVHT